MKLALKPSSKPKITTQVAESSKEFEAQIRTRPTNYMGTAASETDANSMIGWRLKLNWSDRRPKAALAAGEYAANGRLWEVP
jgi:hypothetical protein